MTIADLLQSDDSEAAATLRALSIALAEQHERHHPPRVALPKGYDPVGKSLYRVRLDTGIGAYAIRRIFRRLGLSHQIRPFNAAKTHCKRGHAFTAENTYIQRRGGGVSRICLACSEIRRLAPERLVSERARHAERRKNPHYRAYMRAYLKAYRAEYRQRPDVKERTRHLQRQRRKAARLARLASS